MTAAPPVIGTPARYGPETHRRKWAEKRKQWVAPVHPDPLVRARPIEFTPVLTKGTARNPPRVKLVIADFGAPEVEIPAAALAFAKAFIALPGWTLRANYAHGWDMNSDGTMASTDIKEPTGETTPTGRPAMRKVGETVNGPVHSFMLCAHARRDEGIIRLQGLWIGTQFAEGRLSAPPGVPFALIGYRDLSAWRDRAAEIEVIA